MRLLPNQSEGSAFPYCDKQYQSENKFTGWSPLQYHLVLVGLL